MLLTIRDVLSCTWLLPMGFQESSRYGCGRWGTLIAQILVSRTGRPGKTLIDHSAFSSSQAVINSGVQVDLEARDFEGKLDYGHGQHGRWDRAG